MTHRWHHCHNCTVPHNVTDYIVYIPCMCTTCQEIGLVAFMFFFELLFSYVSLAISFYISCTNLFSITHSPYLPNTWDTQDKGETRFRIYQYRSSLKIILQLRNLSRFLNRPLDPMVDLYQSLHSNSASTTSMSPTILTTGWSSILLIPRAPKKVFEEDWPLDTHIRSAIGRYFTQPETCVIYLLSSHSLLNYK